MNAGIERLAVALVLRAVPLPPAAVAAHGAAATALARRLLDEDDEALARLEGVRTRNGDVLVLRGPPELLPWVDGLCWLGEAAPGLFLPTTHELNAPVELVRAALARELPLAMFPMAGGAQRVSLQHALPLSREVIALVAA